MTGAAMLLAAAIFLGTDAARRRSRSRASTASGRREATRPHADAAQQSDPLAAAFTLDILAACLRSGMAVSTAAAAAACSAPRDLAQALRRAADLLALGADPATAWTSAPVRTDHRAEALMRMARRSSASGTALAQGVSELAAQFRDDAADSARAASERASVLIAGPLGLCYLPAFVCLGIVPVVAGLARDVLQSGVL
jgi:pilus assembly protein TadC